MGDLRVITLKEHHEAPLPPGTSIPELITYLDETWMNRLIFGQSESSYYGDGEPSTKQPFFNFSYDHKIKARNYVGFVQWGDLRIEVLPKVFENQGSKDLWPHLSYWLSYCRRINFPFSQLESVIEEVEDLPEALIYTFAKHTRDLLLSIPFSRYEELVETSTVMKGRLDFNRYVNEQFSKGNPHQLVVEHNPLLYNNLLNQIIKSVAYRLQGVCRFEDTFHLLQDILFHLDGVDEVPIVAQDCDRVHLNRLFEDYSQVLDMCRFFLSDGNLSNEMGDLQNFSFMLPMEVIYEDFLAGFIEAHFSDRFKVRYQSTGWLTDQQKFKLKYDILLEDRETGKKIIVDAKYKLRQDKGDGKYGISQNDLYQMLAYAIRTYCQDIVLFYPTKLKIPTGLNRFTISSSLFSDENVRVYFEDIGLLDLNPVDQKIVINRLAKIFNLLTSQ